MADANRSDSSPVVMSSFIFDHLEPIVSEYLDYLSVARNARPRTRRAYGYTLSAYVRCLRRRRAAGWRVETATTADVLAWLAAQADSTQVSSRRCRLALVRTFYAWLVKTGRRPDNPAAAIDSPRMPKRVPQVLSVEAVTRLLDAPWGKPWPGWRNRACAELLYGCGIRVDEAASLTLDRLDLGRRVVRIIGKGDKERVLPVPRRVVEHLEPYLALRASRFPDAPAQVFLALPEGRPLAGQGIWRMLVKRSQDLGLPRVRPHRLRAACATHLIQNGVDPRTVQALMGHESFETTQRFYLAAVQLEEMQAAVDRAHPLAQPPRGE